MIDTVIFDMDGLLVDSEPLWMMAMQEVFASVGAAITPQLAAQTTGLRTVEVVDYWHRYFQWKEKPKEQVTAEIIDSVTRLVLQQGKPMQGVPYILNFFKDRGLRMGLASSSPMGFIEAVLEHFQLRSYFSAVASAEHEPYGKPHPAVYLSCARSLGSNPLHCLAFEDSINGTIAARAARMKVVAVPEMHNRQNPRYVLADVTLDALTDFTESHLQSLGR